MPQFVTKDPADVKVGRARAAGEAVRQYVVAIGDSQAGEIFLDEKEKQGTVRHTLGRAAAELGFKVRCSFDAERNVLIWKAVAP